MRRVKTWPCDAEDCVQRVIVTKRNLRLVLAVVRAVDALGACGLSPILQDADKLERLWSALDAFNKGKRNG